jgi:Xaa-Pro aminopeptidase
MVLEIHPNIRVPGMGYCALGDMLLVTETGNERLTAFPRDHFVVS